MHEADHVTLLQAVHETSGAIQILSQHKRQYLMPL